MLRLLAWGRRYPREGEPSAEDAIGGSLLAGARADKTIIRQGADACEVEAALFFSDTRRLDMVLADRPLPSNMDIKGYSHPLGECGIAFLAARVHRRLDDDFPEISQALLEMLRVPEHHRADLGQAGVGGVVDVGSEADHHGHPVAPAGGDPAGPRLRVHTRAGCARAHLRRPDAEDLRR